MPRIIFRTFYLFLLFVMATKDASAQPWLYKPYMNYRGKNNPLNLYDIQKAFNRYEKIQKINTAPNVEVKFPGYAQYKRWEAYMEPRVYPSGDITLPSIKLSEFNQYLSSPFYNQRRHSRFNEPEWIALGPTGTITNGDFAGAARVNFIRFDPVNPDIMWTVSPLGGLWKSIDGGQLWTTNTDQLPIIGCSDIAINPLNTGIMYLATGDANATGSQLTLSSIGILKSTDGGNTWPLSSNTMNWQVSWGRNIYKLLINPLHPDTVLAATSVGVYRTTDGGLQWTQVQAGQFTDIEFKPGNYNIVYASSGVFSGGSFYKSIDAGENFQLISDGLPLSNDVARFEIGVTSADSNYVYVVAVKKNTYDFYGFYRSVNGGEQFTLQATTPNILSGNAGSQAWYNLSMAVSPIHKDTILVGATNIWRSTDSGITWVKQSSETGGFIPFVHPDHHALEFFPGTDSVYYSGNDGGIFITSNRGESWSTLNEGLQIAQLYKFGVSPLNPYTVLTGHQDMGTQIMHDTLWNIFTPNTGDGMECVYEHDNDTIRYLESYKGRIIVTYNSYPLYNVVCTNTGSGVNAAGNWVTPFIMHPYDDSTLLVGKAQVWRTIDGGGHFSQVGNVTGGSTNLTALAYAVSDPQYIYAAKSNRLFVSTDGNTFSDKTGILPVSLAAITAIAVSNTDPEKVWITFSGYSAANKVWYSSNAGDSWINYSTGLPNLPVNCIRYQHAANDALYVGTDVGVYFIDQGLTAWQPFFAGLPNVGVEELDIAYSIGKIRAATNGRGLWESDLAIAVPTVLIWEGSISSDWNNPSNWEPNGVPTSMQDVIIPEINAPNYDPVVNVPGLRCKHLTLSPGANMLVPDGNYFITTTVQIP
jgi:photosystem II stability/assembly factor-like uncharacterized protein